MITEEQRLERNKGIGGSDIAIILGLSKYKTPYQLFLEKKGLMDSQSEENNLQYWGNRLESVIRDEFAMRNKLEIEEPDTIVHPINEFLRGNLDGFIPEHNCVLEIKCAAGFNASKWGETQTDGVPLEYLCQVAYYVALTNAKGAYIAVLIGGNDYREYYYERNMELENKIIDAAVEFWQAVQHGDAPPATDYSDIKLMFPEEESGKTVALNEKTFETYEKLINTKQQMKNLELNEKEYKLELMTFMKDADTALDLNSRSVITWKTNKRGSRTFLIKGE